jgi:hypothetical protein
MAQPDRPLPGTVVGLFDDGAAAQGAVNELVHRGVPPARISVVAPPSPYQPTVAASGNHGPHAPAEPGDQGGRASDVVARRTSVAAADSRETGPVYAAGPVREHLRPPPGQSSGASRIDLPGELRARGLSEAEAVRCAEAVHGGRVLVLADVGPAEAAAAVAALRETGGAVLARV